MHLLIIGVINSEHL